ncbi:MAG TPA: SUMF1/EgtB/PvdO family nonheme iron enzyme, partial [Gemmatimonadales bacterium]|nr:SUMF1/EgtB/PvdO family nonheme iron enzyme [Gemmatimonadales bacterium]
SGQRRARRQLFLTVGPLVLVVLAALAVWAVRGRTARRHRPAAPAVPAGMVAIAGGSYVIGRGDGPAWVRPAHAVVLAPFDIERTEVTVGAYRRFTVATLTQPPWKTLPDSLLPVTGVMWAEATAYCAWKYPGGRLPSEEEWEAAARGADARRYPWGAAWSAAAANTQGARRGGLVPVGSYPAGNSPLGLEDLIGNVWEWTRSPAVAYPGGAAPPRSAGMYVIRGGAYNTPDSIADATWRGREPATGLTRDALAATGFRCVLPAATP